MIRETDVKQIIKYASKIITVVGTRLKPYNREVDFSKSLYQKVRVSFGKLRLEKETEGKLGKALIKGHFKDFGLHFKSDRKSLEC